MLKRIQEKHKEVKEKLNKEYSGKVTLDFLKKIKIAYIPYNELLKEGFIAGIGWSFGVTVGFVIISSIIVIILKLLGGIPFIGSFIADIVQQTQMQLLKRTPL